MAFFTAFIILRFFRHYNMVDTHIHEFFYRFEGSLKYLQQQERFPNALYNGGSHSRRTGSYSLQFQSVIQSGAKLT